MASWRNARLAGEAPESRPTIPPVSSRASPTNTQAITAALRPPAPKRYGNTGTIAPRENSRKLETAADTGEPVDSSSFGAASAEDSWAEEPCAGASWGSSTSTAGEERIDRKSGE